MMIKDIINHTDSVIFKEFLSDTVTSFRKKIETHSENNKIIITEF